MTDEKAIRIQHSAALSQGYRWFLQAQELGPLNETKLELEGSTETAYLVDLIGLKCPEPLMMLRQAFRQNSIQDFVLVFATDPSTQRDFQSFCQFAGHGFLASEVFEAVPPVYGFLLRKQPSLS